MNEIIGHVMSSKKIGPDTHLLSIQASKMTESAKPGQFVHIKCGNDKSYVLRRPISIHRVNGGVFEVFFKVVGKGSQWLSRRKKGDEINFIGPIGNGFEVAKKGQTVLLVAGGMGVAPLAFLADYLAKRQCKLIFAYGARCRDDLHFYIDVKRISHLAVCSTEDGSYGFTGLITQTLPEIVKEEKVSYVYACGPNLMLKAVAQFCLEQGLEGQVAMEERMACGIGACLSCVCKIKSGDQARYKRVCVDGPVFNIKEVVWE